jgi:predicted nucleic acid-binding Zn ribbon protein
MRICPSCGNIIKGRKDKVYCSATCRSAAQYENRMLNEQFYLIVDKQLKTNRKILKRYNKSGYTTLRKEKLLAEGFNPKFFTHYWKNNKGQVYLFCFDFGFLELDQEGKKKYLLVEWQKYMEGT